jgi:hypothetical protein
MQSMELQLADHLTGFPLQIKNNRHFGMLRIYRISTNLLFSLLYIKLARQQRIISATSEAIIQSKIALNLNEIASC